MEGFPSGQREQTVNLSSMTSVVRIHHLPPKEPILIRVSVLFWRQVEWIRKPALRNVPVARFNRRGFRRNGSESTTGRVGRRVAVRLWDCTSQSRQARAINGASALRNVPVARFNHRGFRRNGSESITERAGRRVAVRLWDCTSQSRQARALNGVPALRNVPVARFNRRGLPVGRQPLKYLMVVPAAKRIHHRTGRQACSSATMGGNNQSRQARARSEGKNRLCSIAKSTCTGYLQRYIAVWDVIP